MNQTWRASTRLKGKPSSERKKRWKSGGIRSRWRSEHREEPTSSDRARASSPSRSRNRSPRRKARNARTKAVDEALSVSSSSRITSRGGTKLKRKRARSSSRLSRSQRSWEQERSSKRSLRRARPQQRRLCRPKPRFRKKRSSRRNHQRETSSSMQSQQRGR